MQKNDLRRYIRQLWTAAQFGENVFSTVATSAILLACIIGTGAAKHIEWLVFWVVMTLGVGLLFSGITVAWSENDENDQPAYRILKRGAWRSKIERLARMK